MKVQPLFVCCMQILICKDCIASRKCYFIFHTFINPPPLTMPGMPEIPARGACPPSHPMPQDFRRPSPSDVIEADVVDNITLMRRTLYVIDNAMVTGTEKRDIPNRQETASFPPCFWYSSQNGLKSWGIIPFEAKIMAKTASLIPSILRQLEEI